MNRRLSWIPNQVRRPKRKAAVLVAALVVLFLVGMITTQTLQTAALMRTANRGQNQFRQLHEVIDVGRRLLEELPVGEQKTIQWQLRDEAVELVLVKSKRGSEQDALSAGDVSTSTVSKIHATIAKGTPREVVATWSRETN